MQLNIKKILMIAGILLSSSCSTTPNIQEFPATASATDEIKRLNKNLMTAMTKQVNVLSPDNFDRAKSSLEKAQERQSKRKDPKETLLFVAKGNAYLEQANSASELSHRNIEAVVVARQQAIDAGAYLFFPEDFNDIDDQLKDVTEDLENNKTANALKNQERLQANYRDLQLRAIKHANLGYAIKSIQTAKQENAENYAPRSLAIAEKKVQDTQSYITGNRNDSYQIGLKSQDAIKSANHLLKITRNVKAGKSKTGEDTALAMEAEQKKTAISRQKLSNSQEEVLYQEGQVAEEKMNTREALNQNDELEMEKLLNARYEDAQKQFTKSEAEVYKQDKSLIIRLRGLKFAVAKSTLQGDNFALLSKVQKVIKDFNNSSIMIEGYTDTDGGKKLNQKLSKNRAETVRQYFISSAGIKEESIKAIGHGETRPLAPKRLEEKHRIEELMLLSLLER